VLPSAEREVRNGLLLWLGGKRTQDLCRSSGKDALASKPHMLSKLVVNRDSDGFGGGEGRGRDNANGSMKGDKVQTLRKVSERVPTLKGRRGEPKKSSWVLENGLRGKT